FHVTGVQTCALPISSLRTPDAEQLTSFNSLTTPLPAGVECFSQWLASCRIRIDYPSHIQPLWSMDRRQLDPVSGDVLQDNTCVKIGRASGRERAAS